MSDQDRKKYLLYRYEAKKRILEFFNREEFLGIDPPSLIKANAPDPYIDPLLVRSVANNKDLQLHTSPEFFLKRAVALGFPKVYALCRVYRDDPVGLSHGLEFTMLEWYRSQESLDSLITDCDRLFEIAQTQAQKIFGNNIKEIPKIQKKSLIDTFYELLGIDLIKIQEDTFSGHENALSEILKSKNEYLRPWASFQDAFFHCLVKYIEPALPKGIPTALTHWPIQLAALSRPSIDNAHFCDRFEVYYHGLEIANAYGECNNREEIRTRFLKENNERSLIGKPQFDLDEDFLKDLEKIPQLVGIALGFERLLMAVSQEPNIKDFICI